MERIIRKSFDENYERFDFMVGTEDYKLNWTGDSAPVYSFALYRGQGAYYLHRLREQLVSQLHSATGKSKAIRRMWIKLSKLIR